MKYCKTCQAPLQLRQATVTPEKLKKQFYYSAYYVCPTCKKIYLDEKFKVMSAASHPEQSEGSSLFGNDASLAKPDQHDNRLADIDIWTDGACTNNGTERAKAAWAFVTKEFQDAGRVDGKQTNNTAEAYAIYHALLWAAEQEHKKIILHSDSQITIGNLRKEWQSIKENQDIFRLIHEVIERNNLHVTYKKVLGHSGDPNNERADRLAVSALKD